VRRLLALTLVVGLAGCGGHDSRTPYAKSLDALCKSTRKELEHVPRPTTPQEIKTLGEQVNTIGTGFVRRLKALEPEPGERARAQKLVTLYDAFWKVQPRLLQLLEAQQYNVYSRLEESVSRYSKQAETIAAQLGAKECAIEPLRK
jgi:hypothetical protein